MADTDMKTLNDDLNNLGISSPKKGSQSEMNGVHEIMSRDLTDNCKHGEDERDDFDDFDEEDEEVEAITSNLPKRRSDEFSFRHNNDEAFLGVKIEQRFSQDKNDVETRRDRLKPCLSKESAHRVNVNPSAMMEGEVTYTEFESGEIIPERTSSGQLLCDCEECINHADVLVCECENCVQQREATVSGSLQQREIICECENCLNHQGDAYVCECEKCLREQQRDKHIEGVLNNNPADSTCKCDTCLELPPHSQTLCECSKCMATESDHVVLQEGSPVSLENLDHRTSPQGMSGQFRVVAYENVNSEDEEFSSEFSGEDIYEHYDQEEEEIFEQFPRCEHCDVGHSLDEHCAVDALSNSDDSYPARDSNCSCGSCQTPPSLPHPHCLTRQPINVNIQRLLEDQLQKSEKDMKKKDADYQKEIKSLRKENEKAQKVINQSLSLTPEAKIEATMQHEITRLTSENLDLREVIDNQAEQIRKLKKMLKVYAKRLKDGDAAEIQAELENDEARSVEKVAHIKHRERNYMGMFEYRKEDEGVLLKGLIMELKPKIAAGQLPGLPAYILFMCVRHTDYINDDEKVRSFLTGTINGIKKVVKRHHDDIERVALWLANTCRFLHTLKQYSGEKTFQSENTSRQNEHCLRNFDLAEYRQVFSDLAVWIFQTLIKLMEATIQPSIVGAVLEHEAIAGLTGSKPSGLRGRTGSRDVDLPEHSLDSLMKSMNHFIKVLTQHAVDPELVKQIFKQLYYFLGASALNNLLLRKDMCNWSKGMQIRYNLSHLEQWLRDNHLQESGATSTLEPIVQASQLLQARKTEVDVESVCDMCSKLTVPQIVKILNLYTPVDEFEERVPIVFIRKIQEHLKARKDTDSSLLMNLKFSYSVTFPFNPSKISLETVECPKTMQLDILTRL